MPKNQKKQSDYDLIEYKERIANMINEGGLGVSAHYNYEMQQKEDSKLQTEK